jgi:hypothetical protein
MTKGNPRVPRQTRVSTRATPAREARVAVTEPRNGAARWSRFVPLCAISALLIGAVACLNPIPDDFPNQHDDSAEVELPDPPPGSRPAEEGPALGSSDGSGAPPSPSQPEANPGAPDAGVPDDAGTRATLRRSDAGADAGDAGASSEAVP